MEFLYPLVNYLQPGVLFPQLAHYKPMLLAALIAGLFTLRAAARPDLTLTKSYFTQPPLLWLLAFVVVQVISVYYAGLRIMLHTLEDWAVFPIFVMISLFMLKDARSLRRYIWGTIIGSAFVIFYGLHAVAVHSAWIIMQQGRAGAYGMYQNNNDYTYIIIMVLPFAYLYLHVCRNVWQKLTLIAVIIGGIGATLLSLSRGGMLALVLETLLMIVVTMSGGRRVATVAALLVVGIIASLHLFHARELDQAGTYTLQDSADSRFQLWHAAREMWEAHPLLGVGSGQFHDLAPQYAYISRDNRGKVAHNTYLDIAADSGTLGLGTFMLMLWGVWKQVKGAKLKDATRDGVVEAQVAGKVMLIALLFRSIFDAKEADWSFYFLVVVGISTTCLLRVHRQKTADAPRVPKAVADSIARGYVTRYGRRHGS